MISVIVPVYKVEKYIDKCIKSILEQSYQEFELILVDDGSPDGSGVICDKYAETDSRIKVIHKSNGGLSSARNAGIEIAKGKYVSFVDADDWVESSMYDKLISAIEMYDVDIAVCGYARIKDNRQKQAAFSSEYEEGILDQESAFSQLFTRNDRIKPYAWNKLYRREIFDILRYPEGMIYEDVYVISEVLLKCKKIYYTTEPLYNYYQRYGSITKRPYNKSQLDSLIAAKKNYDIFAEKYPQYMENIRDNIYLRCFKVLDLMQASNEHKSQEYRVIRRYIRKELNNILFSDNISFKRKIYSILLTISDTCCCINE